MSCGGKLEGHVAALLKVNTLNDSPYINNYLYMKKLLLLLVLPLLMMAAVSCEGVLPIPGGPDNPNDPDKPGVDDPILDEIIEFKDPNFLKALLKVQQYGGEYGMEEIDVDTNRDRKISKGEASKVKKLYLIDVDTDEAFNVKEMPEIKYFTALEHLNCTSNPIITLDLSENKKLRKLELDDNEELRSLVFGDCPDLSYLSCAEASLSELDLSGCPSLTYLYLSVEKLQSLDLSNNTELRQFGCCGTQLTSLDLSNSRELTQINCSDCGLNSLDISNNPNLTILSCGGNRLTELNLSSNPKLDALYCEYNQLTSLDFSNNSLLFDLVCNNNKLTHLDLGGLKKLQTLNVSDNPLKELNLSGCAALGFLQCNNTQLTVLDLSDNGELNVIYCSNNPFEKIIVPWSNSIDSYYFRDIINEYGEDIIEYIGAPALMISGRELPESESYTSVSCNIKAEAASGISIRLMEKEEYNQCREEGESDYSLMLTRYGSEQLSPEEVEQAASAEGYDWYASNVRDNTKYILLVMAIYPRDLYKIEKIGLQTAAFN